MTSSMRKIVVAAAITIGIGMIPVVAPAYMDGDGQPPSGKHFEMMAKELGLTAEQKQALNDTFIKNKPQTAPIMKQMVTERRALRTLIQAEIIDEAAIRAQSAKVAAIEADLAVQRAHSAQDFRKVLTSVQLQKFKAMQDQRDSKRDKFLSRSAKESSQVQ
jgi:periplasmic protein CpxP/Spy